MSDSDDTSGSRRSTIEILRGPMAALPYAITKESERAPLFALKVLSQQVQAIEPEAELPDTLLAIVSKLN